VTNSLFALFRCVRMIVIAPGFAVSGLSFDKLIPHPNGPCESWRCGTNKRECGDRIEWRRKQIRRSGTPDGSAETRGSTLRCPDPTFPIAGILSQVSSLTPAT